MRILTRTGTDFALVPKPDGTPASKQDVWLSTYNAAFYANQPWQRTRQAVLAALNADSDAPEKDMAMKALDHWQRWVTRG